MTGRSALVRVTALVLAAGGLVAGAALSSTSVQLAEPSERAGLPQRSDVLVEESTLFCPGQSRLGAEGLRAVPGTVRIAALAPPAALVPGASPSSTGGLVDVAALPTDRSLSSADRRASAVSVTVPADSAEAVSAQGTRELAPGLVASQTWLRTGDDFRGLAFTPCTLPSPDIWFVGGADGPSRTERLVLTNPGANAVTVRLEVHGAEGAVQGTGERTVSIAPRSRVVVSVDALAPDEPRPVVHAIASGGMITGVLVDSWIDGATARGTADVTGSAPPATDLVVPGVDAKGGAVLRLVNPGKAEALVQVRLLSTKGARQPETLRAVRVPALATTDVPLTDLLPGETGVRLLSDQPVTAGVWVERRAATGADRMGDFGWAPATPALRGLGGLAVPQGTGPRLTATLALATDGGGGAVGVTTATRGTTSTRTITLPADGSTTVSLGAAEAVWVTPTSGRVHAAVMLEGGDAQGPLYAVAGVTSAPLTALSVPVRQVGN